MRNNHVFFPLSLGRPKRGRLVIMLGALIMSTSLVGMTLMWAFFTVPSSMAKSSTASMKRLSMTLGTQEATEVPTTMPSLAIGTLTPIPVVSVPPLSLKHRAEGTPITASGKYEDPFHGSLGGKWLMFYRGDYLTLTGQGYFLIRWEVGWFNRVGSIVMPTWTDLKGTMQHVASGGGHRMDDQSSSEPGQTWMGNPKVGYDTLPPGTPMIWQNEFYYLDGTVTLHQNERGADYNLGITPKTWNDVNSDVNHPPTGNPWIRYGVVYDH